MRRAIKELCKVADISTLPGFRGLPRRLVVALPAPVVGSSRSIVPPV